MHGNNEAEGSRTVADMHWVSEVDVLFCGVPNATGNMIGFQTRELVQTGQVQQSESLD
jgi:hypothetical protein